LSLINIEKTITLDVYDHDTTPSVIKSIQMDTGTRTVFAMIQNARQDYNIGQNAAVSLTVLRPDKTKVQITGQTFVSYTGADGTIYGAKAELSDVALAVKGNLKAQFKITSGEQELRTEIFAINNGEALDAADGDWAGDLDGHNLDEMAQDIEDTKAAVSEMETDVSELKSGLGDIVKITKDDYSEFPSLYFTHGDFNTQTGVPLNNRSNRACTKQPIAYDKDIVIYIPDGFRVYLSIVNNGVLTSIGWKTGAYKIVANQQFCCTVARVTEDASEAIDIPSFLTNIRICNPVNLLDYASLIAKTEISTSTGVASYSVNSGYQATDFVEIPNGCKPIVCSYAYTGSTRARVAFYDANKDFISAVGSSSQNQLNTPIPATAKYIRCGTHSTIPMSSAEFFIPTEKDVPAKATHELNTLTDYANGAIVSVNHRGYRNVAPENTIPAFAESVRHGFSVVETDLRKTSDGVYVLLHDMEINRTARNADGSDLAEQVKISDITYAQALTYDFGIFKGQTYQGTKIPTLEEALLFCRKVGLAMVIELQYSSIYTDADVRAVLDIVKRCGMEKKVCISCFFASPLQYVLSFDPSYSVMVNISESYTVDTFPLTEFKNLLTGRNTAIMGLNKTVVTDALVNLIKDNGFSLAVWVVDTLESAKAANPYTTMFVSDELNVSEALKTDALGGE
jgi:glycerophosphoryl diester phosphodiesterase